MTYLAEAEIKVKRSRFVARVYKCETETAARVVINDVKTDYRSASHWVYAYVIDGIMRQNDNGEPPGTAGIPVLNAMRSAGLNNAICVVTRWFGGRKLGVDGLRAAYGAVAAAACVGAGEH